MPFGTKPNHNHNRTYAQIHDPNSTFQRQYQRQYQYQHNSCTHSKLITNIYDCEGLSGNHQLQNASLAIKLVHTYLRLAPLPPQPLPSPPPSESGLEPASQGSASLSRVPDSANPAKDLTPLPAKYIKGLENARWPGRCQAVLDPAHERSTWFLDGAHTIESLACCGDWLVSPHVGLSRYVIIFTVFMLFKLFLTTDLFPLERPPAF